MSPHRKERGFEILLKGDDEPDSLHESHSWKIISDQVAVKRMDKSSFIHHEMAIPVRIRPFFNLGTMVAGEKRPVVLAHGVIEYPGYFEMLTGKNPRTRLVWKSDLQNLIQEKFPAWAAYFRSHAKPRDTTPDLKIKKTRSASKFLVMFEDIRRSSDSLEVLKVYSREELKNRFQVTDAVIRDGIFIPKDTSSVWLFITEEKSPDGTYSRSHFDGQVLRFEGPAKGKPDGLIISHESEGNEIVVLYRKKKRDSGFQYVGRFSYHSHTPGKFIGEPARFIMYPLDVMQDDDSGNLVAVGQSSVSGGKPIQTSVERDPRIRKRAIRIHGTTCAVCGFNFTEKYGSFGEGYIEIHCRKPSIRGEKDVDPETDLVPVCPNCHRMIHRADPMLTVEEMKKILR